MLVIHKVSIEYVIIFSAEDSFFPEGKFVACDQLPAACRTSEAVRVILVVLCMHHIVCAYERYSTLGAEEQPKT